MRGSRTPEREALLRAEYADAVDVGALLARVNALPGPPIRRSSTLRTYANSLGLRKSAAALDAIFAPIRSAGGQAIAGRLKGDAIRLGLRIWTPERLAMLRAEYPTAMDNRALRDRISALPGIPMGGRLSISSKATRLGIHKAAGMLSAIAAARTMPPRPPKVRTPERRALMQAEYPTATDPAALLAALNALDGPPLSSLGTMQSWAAILRLRKTPETLSAIRMSHATAARVKASRTPEAIERRKANERARAARHEAKRTGKEYAKPKAPEMRRGPIAPPVAREPEPTPVAVEQSPALADRVVERKHDMARRMIAKQKDAALIAQTCALPLREVFRLVGEIRMERHLNATTLTERL